MPERRQGTCRSTRAHIPADSKAAVRAQGTRGAGQGAVCGHHLRQAGLIGVEEGADLHMLRHQGVGAHAELPHLPPAVEHAQGLVLVQLIQVLLCLLVFLYQVCEGMVQFRGLISFGRYLGGTAHTHMQYAGCRSELQSMSLNGRSTT